MKNYIALILVIFVLSACGGGGSNSDGTSCGNCDAVRTMPAGSPPNADPSKTILGGALKCVVIPPMSQVCTGT